VFFHGGGWVAGDINTHDRNARTLAIELKAVVLSVDYRRPPETPFPGTFDDCLAATRRAAENIGELGGDGRQLAVAGDSAGGNLAAAVAGLQR
jgi:acetyl esterase